MRACALASTRVFHSSLPVFLSIATTVSLAWSPTRALSRAIAWLFARQRGGVAGVVGQFYLPYRLAWRGLDAIWLPQSGAYSAVPCTVGVADRSPAVVKVQAVFSRAVLNGVICHSVGAKRVVR